ncbi:carboxymuconolactone decarboxylase family protein [Providencia hangzhouensis]|uniref:Alkylhydroperoxidase n=2 Tax=Providencia TaxID=586 RepID=A0A264VVG9_PRORE|nr:MULTISPECIES: carboxymuconolactone decarboxylase family protein [Providencia]MBN6366409.1 carboxymuconolactone decarboxylase family protein [Providencia rettgeri]MBN7841230.1 carboxymuconolactone decarboxylase family protein [Providencia rettgeri]MBN7853824.1 carboxymuconolactone decarboxylase family protein [Providencia rettgeri]MBN7863705.1 carboxymuconolactone decarboxylase family protein [Providencia rettgeri]MBN7872917.1 carboxymuconolactone decarboxylase family protein [Providencia re
MSELRLAYNNLSPEAYKGLIECKNALDKSGLGKELIELVYLRVSQINGCAFCLDMHASSLRSNGVSNKKIDTLAGWQVSHHFNSLERAALAWTEAVVNIATSGTSDALFNELKYHFSDEQISDLTIAIGLMSAFNRIAIALRQ